MSCPGTVDFAAILAGLNRTGRCNLAGLNLTRSNLAGLKIAGVVRLAG
jgi:hypothetical protein